MTQMLSKSDPIGQLLLYQTEDGLTKLEVKLVDETVWLTQLAMAELFQTTKQNISLHLKNIFENKELFEDRVVKDYLTTATDGKSYQTKFYNLEAIIAVGYRVRSEDQAKRRKQIFMKDWREKLDAFLKFNERDILTNAGKVSEAIADQLALDQYKIFHQNRLVQEARQEALEDDEALKSIEVKISKAKIRSPIKKTPS